MTKDSLIAEAAGQHGVIPSTKDEVIGLSEAEATRRFAQYGENALVEHYDSAFHWLVQFFWVAADV